MARPGDANRAMVVRVLAGRPVVQLTDLAEEAGLGRDYYDDGLIYLELAHAERLIDAGYRPVIVPVLSGALGVLVFVRGPWPLDAHTGAIHPRLRPYLEDGDPLMALLVGRAQREINLARTH
jgi:hypothetical protein